MSCAAPPPQPLHAAREVDPAAADAITVYRSPVQVADRYREIAVLVAGRDYPSGDLDYQHMRKRAAALGANAIILDAREPAPPEHFVTQYVLTTPAEAAQRVVAVLVGGAPLASQ